MSLDQRRHTAYALHEEKILEQLVELLEASGVTVRAEALGDSAGGLCMVNGRHMLFIDRTAATAARIRRCAQAVVALIDIEAMYLRPDVRELLRSVANTEGEVAGRRQQPKG